MRLSIFKGPEGCARKQLNISEQRSLLQSASEGQELRYTLVIERSELRQNLKQRLRLTCEKNPVSVLVPVNPFHSIAIIEEKCLVFSPIDYKTAKRTVQFFKTPIPFLFIKMKQPRPRAFFEFMSFPPKFGTGFGIDETFSSQKKRDVFALIEEDLACNKGVFPNHDTTIHSHFGHTVCFETIEFLVQ